MALRRPLLLLIAALAGCGDSSTSPSGPDLDSEAPAFALIDVNPNSASHERPVSPRDYLERVSGWYFAHAT